LASLDNFDSVLNCASFYCCLGMFSMVTLKSQPSVVSSITAQIDIAPTILGMLNFNYKSKFFGQDIFKTAAENRRAYISTY
jgi:phosphoglycerol transferase MdoB-like AlkP superfamily enzyme